MKKGFTLIELLAVIVILAVIALIVTPTISKIIDNAKKSTAINSAYNYKDAVDQSYAASLLINNNLKRYGTYSIIGDKIVGAAEEMGSYDVNVSGGKPTSGYLLYEDNVLTDACFVINGYEVSYSSDKFSSSGKGDCGLSTTYYSYKGSRVTDPKNIPGYWDFYVKEANLAWGVEYKPYKPQLNHLTYEECMDIIELDHRTGEGFYEKCVPHTINTIVIHFKDHIRWGYDTMDECMEEITNPVEVDYTSAKCVYRDDIYDLMRHDSGETWSVEGFIGGLDKCNAFKEELELDNPDTMYECVPINEKYIISTDHDDVFTEVDDVDLCNMWASEEVNKYGRASSASCNREDFTTHYMLYNLPYDGYSYPTMDLCLSENNDCGRMVYTDTIKTIYFKYYNELIELNGFDSFNTNKQKIANICSEVYESNDESYICKVNVNDFNISKSYLVGANIYGDIAIRENTGENEPFGICNNNNGCGIDPNDGRCHGPQC